MRTQDLIKKLAGLTAIYGLSSIIGRLLNYLLTPLLTRVFTQGEYGIITELYSYSGFLLVLFVYGMETAFFRYVKSSGKTAEQVYSTVMWSIVGTTALLVGLMVGLAPTIAGWINYPNNAEYVVWFAFIVGLDTLSAIPFALLRYQERAWRFALIRLTNIGVNIGLVLFFLLLCPVWADKYSFIGAWYVPQLGVGYVFIANLIAGAVTLLLLLPQLLQIKLQFNAALWRQMLVYALPLVVVGFAGIVNEMLDRVMLKYLLPYDAATNQAMLGVYGACYKLSILMSLFTQAYRFAAEPLFFAQAERQHAPRLYAQSMKFFVIAGVVIFMGVMLFLDIFQHFIGKDFRVGLPVVPYLLMANLFLGIYYNLSIWYKLSSKTHIGAYISVAGAFITIALNLLLVPQFGYLGAAWATLACYMAMCTLSYFIGGRYYPIPYNTGIIMAYIVAAVLVVAANGLWLTHLPYMLAGAVKILLLALFLAAVYLTEKRQVTA